MKLLVWLLLGFFVYLAVRKNIKASGSKQARPTWTADESDGSGQATAKPSESMVSCAQCQVFIPASEAIHRGTQVFCCDEHAQQFMSKR